jgi:hypothetical protein
MAAGDVPTVTWVSHPNQPASVPVVLLANGSPFPSSVTYRTAIEDGPAITMTATVENGRPVMANFQVERRTGGPAVTASYIHTLPVGELFDQLVAQVGWGTALFQLGHDEPGVVHPMPTDAERQAAGARAVSSQRGRPVSDDDLRKVAEIVRDNDFDPRQQIVRELHLSQRTASRWIAEARRRGLIEEN